MHFLNLTTLSGNKIRINVNLIESYGTITEDNYLDTRKGCIGKTFIWCNGMSENESPYIVEEAPEEIDEAIRNLLLVWYS